MDNRECTKQTEITGDGNIVGDGSESQVIKAEEGSSIGNITQIAGDYHEHHHYPSGRGPAKISPSLPLKAYPRFIGRLVESDQLMSALREPTRKRMIAIVGLGGIGKTALAQEVTELGQKEGLFDYIVWTTSKTEHFVAERIMQTDNSVYGFDTLLSDIGRQCDRIEIAQMPLDQKRASVQHLLVNHRILIVMDNLETVPENAKLVHSIFQILGRSKVLITSRHQVKHEQVFVVNLQGFPDDEGVIFLREEGKERGIEAVAQASHPCLVNIQKVTGGAPLAMKLVVGQMSRRPMEIVLKTLQEASFEGQADLFYRFVYRQSWDMLDLNAQMVLVDMSIFPPIAGGAVEDVEAISQVDKSEFWKAMDQLITFSLVDKIGPAEKERFALHPLTQYFIKSDITKEWAEE